MRKDCENKWAWEDLNFRPRAYQAPAGANTLENIRTDPDSTVRNCLSFPSVRAHPGVIPEPAQLELPFVLNMPLAATVLEGPEEPPNMVPICLCVQS